MKKFFILFFCVLWSEVLCSQDLRLSGKVTTANGLPIKYVSVSITGQFRRSVTDSAGMFSVQGMKPGQYEVNFIHINYQKKTQIAVIDNSDAFITITLDPSYHQLKEVNVRNKLGETRRQTESMNIEVVGSEFIQRNLGGSLMQTLDRLPGINTIGIGSGQSKPLIRGLGFNRVVVVDKGVKHEGQQWGADHGLEIDQFAAGEVELIKGAASFLYGSDAIGGVIAIKPRPVPEKHTYGGVVDLIGKSNNNLYGTSANLYARQDHFFYDARVTYQNYGDYSVPADQVFVYDYAVDLKDRRLRNTAGRETALHLNTGYIKDGFRTIFYLSNTYSKSGFFANAHGLEPRRVDTEMHDRSSRDIQMPRQEVNHLKLINRTEYNLAEHKLQMELGYQRNFRQEFSQYVNHGYMPPVYPDTLSIPPDLEREFDKHIYSVNLRDEFRAGKHLLTTGINAEYQHNRINGWTFLVPSFNQIAAGAFIYDKYELNDQVLLHAGMRYDYGSIRLFEYQDWFPSESATGTAGGKLIRANDLTRRFSSVVWSAGINYNPEHFVLKANLGKSFRMPIAKELGANGVNYHYFSYEKGDVNLSAEQSYQVDLSLGWNAQNWSVLISPFYNYFPNYIYLNPTANHDYFYGAGNQVFQYAQSKVMRYGGELKLRVDLLKGLSSEFVGEYLYARQLSGDKKGYGLPFSPPVSGMISLSWSPEFAGNLPGTYFGIDYRIVGKQERIVPPEKKTPGYSVINLQAGTRINLFRQQVALSLQAQNLLNTKYMNHTSFYRLIELPEAGRNLILSLKIPFQLKSGAN